MLVDALREDFIYSPTSQFRFTNRSVQYIYHRFNLDANTHAPCDELQKSSLIAEGHAVPFVAVAKAPTVTKPRLKALTTGSVPSFTDTWQFSQSESIEQQDTWLYQFKARGSKMAFYGDDTWLQLFPTTFAYAEGVTSFFATETVIVDANVTRHVGRALDQLTATTRSNDSAIDVLVLHYLGLDHVGHSSGAAGARMPAKQKEMDAVVHTVYTRLASAHPRTLFVLLGDHGMTDIGNHGGSSAPETSTAMLFISPSFPATARPSSTPIPRINQLDLVPTLSLLFGLPIPLNNVGTVISDLINDQPKSTVLDALHQNARQLYQCWTFSKGGGHGDFEVMVNEAWKSCRSVGDTPQAPGDLSVAFCQHAIFARTGDQTAFAHAQLHYRQVLHEMSDQLASVTSGYDMSSIYVGIALLVCAVALIMSVDTPATFVQRTWHHAYCLGGLLLYLVTLFASSFVEYEHMFHFFWLSLLLCGQLAHRPAQVMWTLLHCTLLRLARGWNTITFEDEPDRSIWDARQYLQDNPWGVTDALVVATLLVLWRAYRRADRSSAVHRALYACALLAVAAYKVALPRFQSSDNAHVTHWHLWLPRIVYAALAVLWAQQSFAVYYGMLECLQRTRSAAPDRFVHTTLLIYYPLSMYFSTGNANSLATVDISNAYTGLADFSVVFTGVLTWLSNWAPTLWWLLARGAETGTSAQHLRGGMLVAAKGRVLATAVLSASVTFFRHHLFIWSVFCPRYCFEVVWALTTVVFDVLPFVMLPNGSLNHHK
ncbi:major facilitator superfamily transporter protein [Sorochytrium milnesiophthora]